MNVPSDDTVTLSRAQWESLLGAFQRMADANASLLQTISRLLERIQADSESLDDPYDLAALRKLVEQGE